MVEKDNTSDSIRYLPSPQTDERAGQLFSAEEQRILDHFNQKVASGGSLDDILDFLFDSTSSICPCDRISLAFLEENNRRVVSHWVKARYTPVVLGKGYAGDLEGSSLAQVVRSGQPRIIKSLEQYSAEHPHSHSSKLLVTEGVRSSMTCPLIVEGRIVGLLFRSSKRVNAYDDHQMALHLALVERLSQAVEKAYRIEQLESANRNYREMLTFVTHELRSPLASIISSIHLIIDGYRGAVNPEQRESLDRMKARAEGLLRLIADYLNLARLEGGELTIDLKSGVDLRRAVLDPVIEAIAPQVQEKRMTLARIESEQLESCECDPALLQIVLNNLMTNAVKYGNEAGRIEVSAERTTEGLRLAVYNEGPGFSDADKQLLFKRFSRLKNPELWKRPGSGLGLYVCWQVVQLHGGHIWAESEPGRFARFVFEIPQPVPRLTNSVND
jgi:signal transduction histidine kinase